MSSFDAVIIGAGVAGIATAYYLSTQHDMHNILLVDRRPPMTLTSDKSGSNYRNWWPHPAMVALSNHSIALMDTIAARQGNFFRINRRGYAYISGVDDVPALLSHYDHDAIRELRVHQNGSTEYPNPEVAGADLLLGSDLVQQHFPFVTDSMQSVIHVRRAGWFSTRVLFMHLLDTATQRGLVEMRGDVTGLSVDGQGVSTVNIETLSETIQVSTPNLILAAGPFINVCAAMLGFGLPTYNVLHQKVMLRDPNCIIPDDMPFMIFQDSPTVDWTDAEIRYLRQHNDREILPGNFHIKTAGDGWIIIGWAFNRQRGAAVENPELDPMFPQVALKGLSSFIPALRDYADDLPGPVVPSGGFYTRTTENLPLIGKTPVDGVYVLGALSGFGVMVACGAGSLLSKIITGDSVPDYANAFALSRYDDPSYDRVALAAAGGEL